MYFTDFEIFSKQLGTEFRKKQKLYFLTVRKIIRFDFTDEYKIGGVRYICTT